jgi:D-3-phosphoglycerate dehydrogenase / 2-oxoglutarate reductase
MKILLTSTSFIDTPGVHKSMLKETGYEVNILRGPVKDKVLLPIIADYDALICGDDELTDEVLHKGKSGKLKVVSKYGVGLDKIDLDAAKKYDIPITNCLGVNHVTVAEHTLALMFTYAKNIHFEHNITRKGEWKRLVGYEINNKYLCIIGLGKIGKELAIRAKALGMLVSVYDPHLDKEFAHEHGLITHSTLDEAVKNQSYISLNLPLLETTREIISERILSLMNNDTVLINTSRALLINQYALFNALENKIIGAYLCDVLEEEPMVENHPLLRFDNVIITPHIGSRTYESVQRQGSMAVENLINELNKIK